MSNQGQTILKSFGNNQDKIGSNCHIVTHNPPDGNPPISVVLDIGCSLMFEEAGRSGTVPVQFFNVVESVENASAIFLSHGHMDHTGAIPHLLKMGVNFPPMYCSDNTKELLINDCKNACCTPDEVALLNALITVVKPGQEVDLGGGVKVTPEPVSHSMAGSLGFTIETPSAAPMTYSGDFKTDETVGLGMNYIPEYMEFVGKTKKPRVLIADSTSAGRPDQPLEREVCETLIDTFSEPTKGTFYTPVISRSNQRMLSIAIAAAYNNRHLALLGTSVVNAFEATERAGQTNENLRIEAIAREITGNKEFRIFSSQDEVRGAQVTKDKLVVALSGTQGEENAALSRAIKDPMYKHHIESGDTIVWTQSIIPSAENEEQVISVASAAKAKGINVVMPVGSPFKNANGYAKVHASGHATRRDYEKLVKDTGSFRTLIAVHSQENMRPDITKIGEDLGLKVHIPENGDSMLIDKEGNVTPLPRGKSNEATTILAYSVGEEMLYGPPRTVFNYSSTDPQLNARLKDDINPQIVVTIKEAIMKRRASSRIRLEERKREEAAAKAEARRDTNAASKAARDAEKARADAKKATNLGIKDIDKGSMSAKKAARVVETIETAMHLNGQNYSESLGNLLSKFTKAASRAGIPVATSRQRTRE